MGLFDIFKKKGLNPNQPTMPFPMVFGQTVMSQYNKQTSVEDSYASNADVYSIVSLLARKASSIPWYVYKKSKDKGAKVALERYKSLSRGISTGSVAEALKWREKAYDSHDIVEDGQLAEILQRPNPSQGQDKFFESLYTWYWLTGEGFIWGNNGGSDNPKAPIVEMFPLPSQEMDHILDPNDIFGILGWKLNVARGIPLSKESVLQWKMPNPTVIDDHVGIRGMSPLQAAYRTSMMGNEAEIAAYSMMKNGGAKGALSPEPVNQQVPMVSIEQAQSIKDFMTQYVNGGTNKGNITVLQTPWKYLDFGLSSVDMQLIESQKITLHKLCRVFGVPVVLFEADYMTDNNYQNALRDLVTNTIVPAIASLRDELNRWLVSKNGNDQYYVDFDIQSLPELQRDIEKLVNSLANAPYLTFDEKREQLGFEALGGNFSKAYINSGLIPLDEVGMDLNIDDESGDMGNGDD
jgi:HK97 family phage portal protein